MALISMDCFVARSMSVTNFPISRRRSPGVAAMENGFNLALKGDGTVVVWGAGTTNAGWAPHYGQSLFLAAKERPGRGVIQGAPSPRFSLQPGRDRSKAIIKPAPAPASYSDYA
jgi:hypothetical protein